MSITGDNRVPSPRTDRLHGEGALFDDTSATAATVTTADLPVAAATRAVQYTLTSAGHADAPAGWVLQGSVDGRTWTDLDRRAGESFPWDRQTRAFTIARPGTHGHCRLVLDRQSRLSEVELLS